MTPLAYNPASWLLELLMRTGGVTKIILCADHFYNKIIACFYAIMRMYAPSLEGSRDAFRHELIIFQTLKLAEKVKFYVIFFRLFFQTFFCSDFFSSDFFKIFQRALLFRCWAHTGA